MPAVKKKSTKKSTKKTIKARDKKSIKKISKTAIKKPVKPLKLAKEKFIGKVVHFFDKIGVAVIALESPLKIEDSIGIKGGEKTDFKQVVKSMEMDHKKIIRAGKGDEVGMKVKEKVREGYKVYKI